MNIMLMGKNPNYLGVWDLYDLEPPELILTISSITDETVDGINGKEKACVCRFAENVKPMIMNPTNRKTIARLYHTSDSSKLHGKKIKVGYEKVRAFGKVSDALRVKNEIPSSADKPREIPRCADCGKPVAGFGNMTAEQVAARTAKSYGRVLCAACAQKAKEAAQTAAPETDVNNNIETETDDENN